MLSSSSPSAQEPRPYEVFLSFRGEDTRTNFISHLHTSLKQRGIRTFFDETNLHNGQTIATELAKAIQESSIAIIILSQNYASSTWCLNELVKIVECKNKLIMFPIFYDVDPSHVRKQEGSFSNAFSIHEVNFKDKIEMVNAWRGALTEVANLTGVDLRGKNEASCIENIVDEILRKLPLEGSHFTKSLVGIESRISEIKRMIYSHPNEVRVIGIWGMGGVGKTTTARAIFEECKSEFEGSCFLQDVRQKKNEMVKLQKQLLSQVLKCKIDHINDVIEGSNMIRERMCFKRVLLVVDDVDDIQQLNVLAGKCQWFGKGSRIIITTRNDHLLNDVHEKYVVGTLPDNEAMHLFLDHAFKNEHPDEHYTELSHQVLRYAGGLPLALKVLGDHLYRQEERFWRSTLSRLQDVPEDEIISKLQISFNGLNSLQQDIFLDIACLFRGKHRDYVMECLRTLSLHPEEGIRVLIQKSLIHESLFGTDTLFEMHDLLQDMGQHIVREKANREVRRYGRLWLEEDITTVLLDNTGSAKAEGIIIDGRFYDDAMKSNLLKEESFMNMNKLRFLQINESGANINDYKANVFESSVQLPNELRWLYWHYFPGTCLGKSFYPRKLVRMEMIGSLIESTPDFSHMPNLEVLNLSFSSKLVHIDPSLGLHMKIKTINFSFCFKLEEFPAITQMDSLEVLDLGWTSLKSLPEICSNVDSLKELYFNNTYVRGLPISHKYATRLEKLKLGWMDDDTFYLTGLSSFTHLRLFSIANFGSLTAVPELPSSLQILEMVTCPALKEYPMSFPYQLQTLQITGSSIERTPDFSHLPHLLELDMSRSSLLSEVHASLGVHKKIARIFLRDCMNLDKFPTIADMGCLVHLELSRTNLQCFPEITGNVDNLANIYLEGTYISTLPESIGRATGLEILNIALCEYLVSLPFCLQSREMLLIPPSRRTLIRQST